MLLATVGYLRPASLGEAVAALRDNAGARPLAGGQSLINVLKMRAASVDLLVDISRLADLQFIDRRDDGGVTIGAGTTYSELERSDVLREAHPKVCEVAAGTVDVQVRNRGTLGGNICYNDPASNFPPLVLALGATLQVTGPAGDREVPAGEFFRGPYRTALERGELLRSVTLPPMGDRAGIGYQSIQVGKDAWAIARAAVWASVSDGSVEDARVVLGCVGPVPYRHAGVEDALRGGPATQEAVERASRLAAEGIEPPSDAYASGDYRRALASVVTKRAMLEAMGERV